MSSKKRNPDNVAGTNRRTVLKYGAGAAVLAASGLLGKSAMAAADVKLGWIQPTTGPLASSFAPNYLAADIAFEEINAAGGILGSKLVKVQVDDQGSPAQEPIVTRKLIDEGCKIILGPVGSSQTLASLEVSSPAKIIQGSYGNATELGDGNRYPYHYSFVFTAQALGIRFAEYLGQSGFKKIGLLMEDTAAGASMRTSALKELPARGMQIVSDQTFPSRLADMTPFLRKLRSDGAEALEVHIANNGDITQLLLGLSRIGWKPVVVGHPGLLYAGTPGAIPENARYAGVLTGTYKALTYTDTEFPSERLRAYVKKIAAADMPETQLGPAATSTFYDFLYALKFAVEKANSWDPDQIKKVLDTTPIQGIFGRIAFTPANHTAYHADVVGMAVSNSTEEPFSKSYKGLFRRRAPGTH